MNTVLGRVAGSGRPSANRGPRYIQIATLSPPFGVGSVIIALVNVIIGSWNLHLLFVLCVWCFNGYRTSTIYRTCAFVLLCCVTNCSTIRRRAVCSISVSFTKSLVSSLLIMGFTTVVGFSQPLRWYIVVRYHKVTPTVSRTNTRPELVIYRSYKGIYDHTVFILIYYLYYIYLIVQLHWHSQIACFWLYTLIERGTGMHPKLWVI